MATNAFAKQMIDLQKQVVEFQRAAFDNSFNAIVTLQDQQEELVSRVLDSAGAVPEEAKEAVESWADSFKKARDDFKAATDRSFELLDQYFDRVRADGDDADSNE